MASGRPDDEAASPVDSTDELAAYLARMTFPVRRKERCGLPSVPFEPLPSIRVATRLALEAAALEANDRYLETFLEPNSFCPFSRGGRKRGQTLRLVYHADTADLAPFFERMVAAARDPSKVVIQVIVPMIEVPAAAWSRFCHDVTAVGNERLGHGEDVFAVAPLHPELSYSDANPFALIPLFRRTPDPTIQWVRLDALEQLYDGRSGDTVYADLDDLDGFLARPRRSPLFDRIAETNMRMARRLGIREVERTLRELWRAAQDRYAQVLLSDTPPVPTASVGCPHRAPVSDTTPPRPAVLERDDCWALVGADELEPRIPRRIVAGGVELVALRVGAEFHVLHGRCPHRHAPLTDAFVEEDRLICPHHGWDFQLATGRSEGVPGESVARFRAWVEDGFLWVAGDELRRWRATHVEVFHADDSIL